MRTRVMGPGGHVYGGVISTFTNLLQKEGLSSMYVGLLPAVISMAPAGAVFYGVYDLLKVSQVPLVVFEYDSSLVRLLCAVSMNSLSRHDCMK